MTSDCGVASPPSSPFKYFQGFFCVCEKEIYILAYNISPIWAKFADHTQF